MFSLSNAKSVIKEMCSIVGYFACSITIIRWPWVCITMLIIIHIMYVEKGKHQSLLDEYQVWCLTGNCVACGSSPGGGGIFFPFFGPLVVSLRSGYLKAESTNCWQTVSVSEVFSSYVLSSINCSVELKSN